MKNIKKLFGIIALVSVIALSFAACDLDDKDPGDDGVQKTLVITDIPITALPTTAAATPTANITNKTITVALCNQKGGATGKGKGDFELYAFNSTTVTSGTVTIPLVSYTTSKLFTGTGNYYILLWFDTAGTSTLDDDVAYGYTKGGAINVEYNITKDTTSISFSQFKFTN
jgi:hypothetical protein